jgi:hypothetical protein
MIKSFDATFTGRVLGFLAGAALILLLGIMMFGPASEGFSGLNPLGSAWAGGPVCDADGDGFVIDHRKCSGPIDCDDTDRGLTDDCSGDPGGGGINVTVVDNEATYLGSVWDELTRFCASEANQATDTASYECDVGGTVWIAGNMGWADYTSKGEQGYCDLLNGAETAYHKFTPTRYWYRNNGGCDFEAGTCDISVSMISYRDDTLLSHNFFDLGGLEDIGKIGIRGHGVLPAIPGEGNVFSINQDLWIDAMSITFFAAGKNRVLADCQILANGDYDLGDIVFHTVVGE